MLIGITGHKGILAKSLIKYLKKQNLKISLYQHNILDYKKLSKWLKRVNIIIHLASVTSIKRVNENKNHARKVNFEATEYLVSCIKNTNKIIIAYEPVWSIGSGIIPSRNELEKNIKNIKKILKQFKFKNSVKILYGGSVNSKNANEFSKIDGIGGLLVGGASLNSKKFVDIIKKTSN